MNSNSGRFHSKILKQWVNLIAIVAAFSLNILANIAPLNGLTIGEISNTFFSDVQIIPANYAFAIWGIIYLGLISLAVRREAPRYKRAGYIEPQVSTRNVLATG